LHLPIPLSLGVEEALLVDRCRTCVEADNIESELQQPVENAAADSDFMISVIALARIHRPAW
jgi:hypothetical protein